MPGVSTNTDTAAHAREASPATAEMPSNNATAHDTDDLLTDFRADAALQVFLEPSFDPLRHTGAAVRSERVSAALSEAIRAEEVLSSRVRIAVIQRKEALLSEVASVSVLEKEVSSVSTGISTLSNAADSLSNALTEPHLPLLKAVRAVRNISNVAALVSALARVRTAARALADAGIIPATELASKRGRDFDIDTGEKTFMEGNATGREDANASTSSSSDAQKLSRAAVALCELERLFSDKEVISLGLEKIDGVARVLNSTKKAAPEVRRRAATLLRTGLANRNAVEVEGAVSTFYAMGMLQERVTTETSRLLAEASSALHKGLDAPRVSANAMASSSSGTNGDVQVQIWSSIEAMFDSLSDLCGKVILLQHVLSRRYCDTTHVSLLQSPISAQFFNAVANALSEQIAVLSRTRLQRASANNVFLALAENFPRLRTTISAFVTRLHTAMRVTPAPITRIKTDPAHPYIPNHAYIQRIFFAAIADIETHYLTASLERLTGAVGNAFSRRISPAEPEALSFAKILAVEISAARKDPALFQTAVSNVATALRLYKSHAEDFAARIVADNADRRQPSITESEWPLLRLYNGMVTLVTSCRRVLGENEDGTGELPGPIAKELSDLAVLSDRFLDAPFSQIREDLHASMAQIHRQDLAAINSNDEAGSVYIMDISAQLSMFSTGLIANLARSRTLGSNVVQLARWTIDTFVKHISLTSPMNDIVRVQLTTDIARLELAVENLCAVRILGPSYHGLRAVRSMLLMSVEDALASDSSHCFSDIGNVSTATLAAIWIARSDQYDLPQPHAKKGVSPRDYVTWLDAHPDEAWTDIESCLSSYEESLGNLSVEQREGAACPEYKVIKMLRDISH